MYSPENLINLKINNEKDFAEYNGIQINKNFDIEVGKLIKIFSTWRKNNEKTLLLDSENVEVEVIENIESQKISFNGNFPQYFDEFKSILKEIIKCF